MMDEDMEEQKQVMSIHLDPDQLQQHRVPPRRERKQPQHEDPLNSANELLNDLSSSMQNDPEMGYEFCCFADDSWLNELSEDESKLDFCFMCNVVQSSDQYNRNIEYNKLLDIIQVYLGHTHMQPLCKLIQEFYIRKFKPFNNQHWSLRSIYEHLINHNPTLYGRHMRTLRALDQIQDVLLKSNIVMRHPESGHIKIHHKNTELYLKIVDKITQLTNQLKKFK